MLYVVGTGRCGTKTVARLLGGLHEPKPKIIVEATNFYLGRAETEPDLLGKLTARSRLDTTVLSDHKQSTVIPLIRRVDPGALFAVLVREPQESIASFLHRGWFRRASKWERNRLRPVSGFPDDWTRTMRCGWLWAETYRVILAALPSHELPVVMTHDLGSRVWNASKSRRTISPTDREQGFLDETIAPVWDELRARASDAPMSIEEIHEDSRSSLDVERV